MPNIASSAMTLSGFSVEELRQFISFLVKKMYLTYTSVKAPDLGRKIPI
jgi:formiminoglutamase